ncbi:hypothetical protein SK128_025923 [Halocaridina rubra]|uniref:Sushi domain-containing protein n=1 Tax=Halocaridina rubra TaxID=373956 RepID=A0AAN8X0G2_HALRR
MKYEGHPDRKTVCQENGTWSHPLPKCLAGCIVPTVENGNLTNDTRPGVQVPHGSTIQVTCDKFYEQSLSLPPATCYNSTWTHYPHCHPARCKRLPERPRHGMVIAPKTAHGMRARYRCKDGYRLQGSATTVCHFGNWTGKTPRCKIIYCPFPGYLTDGRVMLVGNMGMYDYRPYVKKVRNNRQIRYECNKGYYLSEGPPGATCIDGRWSPKQLPKCSPLLHPRVQWLKKRSVTLTDFLEYLNQTKSYLQGTPENETRQDSGPFPVTWQHAETLEIDTDDDNETEDGEETSSNIGEQHRPFPVNWQQSEILENEINDDSDTQAGEKTISNKGKHNGFLPGKWQQGKLSKNGNYEEYVANDVVVASNDIKNDLLDKMVLLSPYPDHTYPSEEPLSYADGTERSVKALYLPTLKSKPFIRHPRSTTTDAHKRRNEWKKVGKKASHCEDPEAGEVSVEVEVLRAGRDLNYTYSSGARVKVKCGEGYGLNIGNKTAKCSRGKWKPTKPECVTLPCLVPQSANGHYEFNNVRVPEKAAIPHAEVIRFWCHGGHTVLGSSILRCWYGNWTVTGRRPVCQPDPCVLPPIENGEYLDDQLPGDAVEHGSVFSYICEEGWLVNLPQITCHLGQLLPEPPSCVTPAQATHIGNILPQPMKLLSYSEGDITLGGDITSLDIIPKEHRSCSPPTKIQGTVIFKNGQPLTGGERRFPDGSEISFNCVSNTMGEKITWKLRCEDGSWVGQKSPSSCRMEENRNGRNGMAEEEKNSNEGNRSCLWKRTQPTLVTFHGDLELTEKVMEFPAGTELVSRCVDIGKYAFVGSIRRRCVNGDWTGESPTCFGLNRDYDYSRKYTAGAYSLKARASMVLFQLGAREPLHLGANISRLYRHIMNLFLIRLGL